MARGKQTCKILKEIRRQIAEANGIEFATSECRYKGDCPGTCPKCESEVRYLKQQLRSRSLAGKAVALAGISAGMVLMSGCGGTNAKNVSSDDILGEVVEFPEIVEQTEDSEEGELPAIEDTVRNESKDLCGIKVGEIPDNPNEVVTQGDIPDEQTQSPDGNGVFICCPEQQAEFPGGLAEMRRFIAQHLKYPEEQLKGCIQGRVIVKFYVDTLGRVCEPQIVRGIDSALDCEALRVVGLFPNFTPGMMNGKKVKTYMTLPISFKLPDDC